MTQLAAPIIILALGEVMLLICGEIDLSVGFIYQLSPFIMYFLITNYHVPGLLAILIALLSGPVIGWFNGFLTVALGLPSFIATLGTGFIINGIVLTTSGAQQQDIPPEVRGSASGSASTRGRDHLVVILTAIFHVLLTRTRWGCTRSPPAATSSGPGRHTSASPGSNTGTSCSPGSSSLVGLQIAFQISIIDPTSGGYIPMFYAVAAAVIGGTAMLGGSGTIIGAFLGGILLAVLTNGFSVIGISAYPLPIIFGSAILLAMIANVQLTRLRAMGKA